MTSPHCKILSFPLSSLLLHTNLNPTTATATGTSVTTNTDILLCNELASKVSLHLINKLHPLHPHFKIHRIKIPSFRVGTFDSLLGSDEGGIRRLEGCIETAKKCFSALTESYREAMLNANQQLAATTAFTLVPLDQLLESMVESVVVGSTEWNSAKFTCDGPLDRLVEGFDAVLNDVVQLVQGKRDLYIGLLRDQERMSPVLRVLRSLSAVAWTAVREQMGQPLLQQLLQSATFQAVLITRKDGSDTDSNPMAAIEGFADCIEISSGKPTILLATVLRRNTDAFLSAIKLNEMYDAQLIDDEILQALGIATNSGTGSSRNNEERQAGMEIKSQSVELARSLYIESLTVGLFSIVECMFHLRLVQSYYESVLEFGLPSVFVTHVILYDDASGLVKEHEVERFMKRVERIVSDDFMVKRKRCCFSVDFSL